MAVGINTLWECRSGATANNVNGAGFNPQPAEANMFSDLTTDTNTGNTTSPVVSSASYNFGAGDVDAWLFLPDFATNTGGNWRPGWYKIASVAANKATLEAAVGQGVLYTSAPLRAFALSTSAGCASVGTPTGGVFCIDYTQQNTAKIHSTDGTSTASTTFTSVTGGFTKVLVGNLLHLISATGADEVVGWHEIISVTDGSNLVLDKTTGTYTAGDFYIGGAASLQTSSGATDDSLFENGLGTNGSGSHMFFIKNGTFASMPAVATAAAGATAAQVYIIGYNTRRVDGLQGDLVGNRPNLTYGSNTHTLGPNWSVRNLIASGTSSSVMGTGSASKILFCKFSCTSVTADRSAFVNNATANTVMYGCELVSYRGNAYAGGNAGNQCLIACYLHDSKRAISIGTAQVVHLFSNIFADCTDRLVFYGAGTIGGSIVIGNTFYGTENTTATGLEMAANVTNPVLDRNIFYGLATAILSTDNQQITVFGYNDFYNNDTNRSGVNTGNLDLAVNPSFTNVTQLTKIGTVSSSTNVLTDTGQNFSNVVDNQDFLVVTGGSGTGLVTNTKLLITAHTTTTVTVSSNITSSGSGTSLTYQITLGHNFAIGANLKAAGFPGLFPGGLTQGYLDVGAVQREEPSGGGAFPSRGIQHLESGVCA